MLIPAIAVTERHQVRMNLDNNRDTGWLDVDTVTRSADGKSVHFRCGPGVDITSAGFTAKADSLVDARLPEYTFRRPGLILKRVADADERGENSTYQGNECVAYSVASYLDLPPHVAESPDAAAEFLELFFEWLAHTARIDGFDLTFEVEVGPDTAADPASYATAAVE